MGKSENADLELLIKMMGLTGSDNDNQALVAIRKANQQVKKLAGSWSELLRGHFTIAADPFQGLGSMPELDDLPRKPPPTAPDRPQTPQADPYASAYSRGAAQARNMPPPPPPNRPAQPFAGMNAGASGPMGTAQSAQSQRASVPESQPGQRQRFNRYRAICFKCGDWCGIGEGWLDHKPAVSGQWKVCCTDERGCDRRANAKKAAPIRKGKSSAARSVDNLANMLD